MTSSSKVVSFLVESPFSERDYERFGVDLLRQNGHSVYIFDCTKIFASKYENIYGEKMRKRELDCLYVPGSVWELCKLLINNKVDYVFDFCCQKYSRSEYLKRVLVLSFTSIIYHRCVFNTGVFPSLRITRSGNPFVSNLKYLVNFILSIPWQLFQPKIEFCAGRKEKISNSGRTVYCHNFDYDSFLSIKSHKSSIHPPYVLYLDSNLIFSTDRIYYGYEHIFSKEKFSSEVNSSLDCLSKNINMGIKIKLHPRSERDNYNKLFNFDIAEESTTLLIKDSDLVVCCATTAIQLAVLFYKPIILWKMNNFVMHKNDPFTKGNIDLMEYISEILGVPLLTTNQLNNVVNVPVVDKEKYRNYIKDYIKSENSSDDFYWNIVSREI